MSGMAEDKEACWRKVRKADSLAELGVAAGAIFSGKKG